MTRHDMNDVTQQGNKLRRQGEWQGTSVLHRHGTYTGNTRPSHSTPPGQIGVETNVSLSRPAIKRNN